MKKLNFLLLLSSLFLGAALITSCDPCKDVDCVNGTCNEGDCDCDEGWEAADCTTEKRKKFLGDYTGNEVCDTLGNVDSYTIGIEVGTGAVSNINIVNFAGFDVDVMATINEDGVSFLVPNQSVSYGPNTAYTFSGSGQKNGSTLTVSYTVIINGTGTSDGCVYTALKDN